MSDYCFPQINNVGWVQDMTGHPKNIPGVIQFECVDVYENGLAVLSAPGHGGNPYGNGCVTAGLEDIAEYEVK